MRKNKVLLKILSLLFISVLLVSFIENGRITYLLTKNKTYSSNKDLSNKLDLNDLSDKEKAFKIFSFTNKNLKQKNTYYSFFENPVSVIFQKFTFDPIYPKISGKKSEFLNTVREPYLLFNLGTGFCHQYSIIVSYLAKEAGLNGRTIWLGGHVTSEIYYNNKWHVFDANQGVVFDKESNLLSYEEIQSDHTFMEKVLHDYGWSDELINNFYKSRFIGYYDKHPLEKYIDIYYFTTRVVSYFLYLLFLWFLFSFATGFRKIFKS